MGCLMKRLMLTFGFGIALAGLPLATEAAQPCGNGPTVRVVQPAPTVTQAPRAYRAYAFQPQAATAAPAPVLRNYNWGGGGMRTYNRHQPAYMNAANKARGIGY